jgi:rod shape-determining protein MreC
MNFLNFDLKKVLLFFCIIALPLISINTQQGPRDTSWYNKPFSFLAGMTQNLFFSFSDGVRGTTDLYLNLIDLKKESARIADQNRELMARLIATEELKKENDRLTALLDFKQQTKMELVAARVMAKDLMSDHLTIQIDKGTHHGLKAGQAVITTEGAVGYIYRPEAFSAQVLLITDRYSVVDGIIARSRARGIVEGKNQSTCALKYVEKSEDIQVGDLVVTSGIDNIFPKGFPIAKVELVESKSYAVSMKVELRPIVDAAKIEEVFVIMNAADEDRTGKVSANP